MAETLPPDVALIAALFDYIANPSKAALVKAQIDAWVKAKRECAEALAESADLDRKKLETLTEIKDKRDAVDQIKAANDKESARLEALRATLIADGKRLSDAREAFDIDCANRNGELQGREHRVKDREDAVELREKSIGERERVAEAKRKEAQDALDRMKAALPK